MLRAIYMACSMQDSAWAGKMLPLQNDWWAPAPAAALSAKARQPKVSEYNLQTVAFIFPIIYLIVNTHANMYIIFSPFFLSLLGLLFHMHIYGIFPWEILENLETQKDVYQNANKIETWLNHTKHVMMEIILASSNCK